MRKNVIISRLLDKYENSKHLFEPGVSNRRVMLRIGSGKKEFPEYDYQDASTRDAFNDAAIMLEKEGLIMTEWVKGRPVLQCISLNLEKVMDCYSLIDRIHPKELAIKVASMIRERLSNISTSWIVAWREEICVDALKEFKVPLYCKRDLSVLEDLLNALGVYDALSGETITMRTFSSKCYHDTKYFEKNVRELFLRIAQKYDKGLSQACEQGELSIRDQLAYLGIYARPELYELAGDAIIHTAAGSIDLHAAEPYGLALPSTIVDCIEAVDLSNIRRITFVENKTNYDEYIQSERQFDELVVYHGGFLSPKKKLLFLKLGAAIQTNCDVYFWADIDLGGFQMYAKLQKLIPSVTPMRMSGNDVRTHHKNGLERSTGYMEIVKATLKTQEYALFEDAILEILKYGVTIEQEVFLSV